MCVKIAGGGGAEGMGVSVWVGVVCVCVWGGHQLFDTYLRAWGGGGFEKMSGENGGRS